MTTPAPVVRTTSMFTLNVYCDVTNFAPLRLLRHVGADKHHLLWSILTKCSLRADMNAGRYDCISAWELSILSIDKKIKICNKSYYLTGVKINSHIALAIC